MDVESLLPRLGTLYTMEDLKSKYRAGCHEVHPDHGGSASDFVRLRALYKALIPGAVDIIHERASYTTDGTPLADLGRGLGPNKNGKDCSQCKGKGYSEQIIRERWTCPDCHGVGYRWDSSVRMFARYGQRAPKCERCLGLGTTGRAQGFSETIYFKCDPCKGTGEIEIWNPVIAKGRL